MPGLSPGWFFLLCFVIVLPPVVSVVVLSLACGYGAAGLVAGTASHATSTRAGHRRAQAVDVVVERIPGDAVVLAGRGATR